MNISGTGMLPYTTIEVHERLEVTFRTWRDQRRAGQRTARTELDAAFSIGWLSHDVADAAQPMHARVHHDGWAGGNPKHSSTEGALHWRFEHASIDRIALGEHNVRLSAGPARVLGGPFSRPLAHLERSHARLELL